VGGAYFPIKRAGKHAGLAGFLILAAGTARSRAPLCAANRLTADLKFVFLSVDASSGKVSEPLKCNALLKNTSAKFFSSSLQNQNNLQKEKKFRLLPAKQKRGPTM